MIRVMSEGGMGRGARGEGQGRGEDGVEHVTCASMSY